MSGQATADLRYMAAAIRFARKHLGRTGTNPSVGTLLVKDGVIVGRGVTAIGGRPHAETQAIAEAGQLARGSTAYVTLEPCAHHGRTPPCAEALVSAGVCRVVIAASDPDPRVSGRGAAMLRAAGIEVVEGMLARGAVDGLSGYLNRSVKKRPEVILKLAVSADGAIGREGEGQAAITGPLAKAQSHMLRAQSDSILIGVGTALADDPELTCRLPGLEHRSPIRIVLDPELGLPLASKLVRSARQHPLWVAALADADEKRRGALETAGARIISSENDNGRIALPELLDDLGAEGLSSIIIEGGASVAKAVLDQNLADRLVLFTSNTVVGGHAIASPLDPDHIPNGFEKCGDWALGPERRRDYVKV